MNSIRCLGAGLHLVTEVGVGSYGAAWNCFSKAGPTKRMVIYMRLSPSSYVGNQVLVKV